MPSATAEPGDHSARPLRLVVLGDPVDHSLSPVLHRAALDECGLSGSYSARRVDAGGMRDAAAEMRSGDLDGASITMPHKALAAHLADRLDGPAERAGAVNTWVVRDDLLVGHNTDVAGIRRAWSWACLPEEGPVLVLGAGGAAAAALLALEGRELFVAARRAGAAAMLLGRLGVRGAPHPWGRRADQAVVVNATPIGMQGESLPKGVLAAAVGLFDMAYGQVSSPAVGEAKSRGIPYADGQAMLIGQALDAFELWTGRKASRSAMESALRTARS